VEQRGSLVEPDRLRFDFVHFAPLTTEEILRIEDTVNEEILASLPVEIAEKSLAEARAMGAMALFGEKYGERVRTVRMGEVSLELCGGTHLDVTSAAGLFRLVGESGVGANLRRVEALTGRAALAHDREESAKLQATAQELGARPEGAVAAAEKMKARVQELEKQLAQAQKQLSGDVATKILAGAREVNGVRLAGGRAPDGLAANALRELADSLSDKLNGVVVLAVEAPGRVLWAVKASPAAVAAGANAGALVREVAKITGGNGGGRPDFAQAGGKEPAKIDEALAAIDGVLAAATAK
jgi:alanyl-tRNA synthetase